jgi:hypothetical protein
MTRVRRLLVVAGALLVCNGAGAAGLEELETCVSLANPNTSGITALEAACPGLETALLEAGLLSNLPSRWRESLNATALADLGLLERRYQSPPAAQAPNAGGLQAILDQLASEQARPDKSWWDTAKEWLQSWFMSPGTASTSWFDRFAERLSQSMDLIKALTYLLLVIVVIGAVAFVVNELRIAGVLSRRRQPRRAGDVVAATRIAAPEPAAGDLDSAALADQPGILLRLLVARLVASGVLSGERSLTHGELVAHAAFSDPDNRQRFARVSQLAERTVYGYGPADGEQIRTVVAAGRSLLQQLLAPGSARP